MGTCGPKRFGYAARSFRAGCSQQRKLGGGEERRTKVRGARVGGRSVTSVPSGSSQFAGTRKAPGHP